MDLQKALLMHLEAAVTAHGRDLPLPVPPPQRRAPRPAAVPAAPAADATAAPRTSTSKALPSAAPVPVPVPSAARIAPAPVAATADRSAEDRLAALRAETLGCRKCKLCEQRKTVVFGEGNNHPDVLFVGEAPGAVEDQTGRPFVGPAGQLLDRILQGAMGLQRGDVYIANINKCRPPGNRQPEPDEVAACLPFLRQQVVLLQPRVVVALGRTAAQNLLGTQEPMRTLRGRDLAYEGIPTVVTWHPAFLLRDPSHKRETWEDIKRVNRLLGRPEIPGAPMPAD